MLKLLRLRKPIFSFFFLLIVFTGQLLAEELPRACPENSFYIMPLFERYRIPGALTFEEKRAQFIKMKDQLGGGNLYHRIGFSSIYHPNVDGEMRQNCQLAQEYRVHIGLIFALQSHTRQPFRNVATANDLRLFQWRKDGIDWKGEFTSSGEIEVPEDQRDYKIPTPSRYAIVLREFNALQARQWAEAAKQLMEDFPGVITSINGPIEEELAIGGHRNNDKLADYSPYAITEFRDWLLHRGMYDATSGRFAGEGACSPIIGQLIEFDGVLRSQFYDDPTPYDANGTGVSFNQYFGTQFTTWNLRYWDLENYPEPITDEDFECTPQSGFGFTSGGFDAPRHINVGSRFWRAWSYDIPDQGGVYPYGNPEAPSYGFRQHMVRNFVRDLFDVMAEAGLPHNLLYAHQIPGEVLGDFTGAAGRNRSSASTIWTGYLEKFQTVGITRFGPINPELVTQYAKNWGIFEWHTSPNTAYNSQVLYDRSISDLNLFYNNNCRFLFPGWWDHDDKRDIFPLNDSRFADAISDFMQQREEIPLGFEGERVDYTPPVVEGIYGFWRNNIMNLTWSNRIWSDLLPHWNDWSDFSHFEIQRSTDGIDWEQSVSSTMNQTSIISDAAATYYVRVRAVSEKELYGPWSETVVVEQDAHRDDYLLEPQHLTMDPDPALTNRIVIRFRNPNLVINPDLLHVSVSGDGIILGSEPENSGALEKFWPMHSASEVSGTFRLDNVVFAEGLLRATVSPITPIDPYFFLANSALDGSALPYVSFRMYSDQATTGQLYWFFQGGHRSISYPMDSGWKIYSFSHIPEWVAQQNITRVRMDPGTTNPYGEIMFDWMSISSQPASEVMRASPIIQGNTASIMTSPTTTPGSYTVSVTYGDIHQEVVVNTAVTNTETIAAPNPEMLLYPNPASGVFTVSPGSNDPATLSIISIDGRSMLQKELSGDNNHVIQVHDLPPGVYIVRLLSMGRLHTGKLIIQR